MARLLCLIVFLGSWFVRAEDPPLSDATIHSRLIGTWVSDPKAKLNYAGTSKFLANGTGIDRVWLLSAPENVIRIDFKWSVKDGLLSETVTKSSDTKLTPVGLTTKDKILAIDKNHYQFEAFEGYDKLKGKHITKVRKNP